MELDPFYFMLAKLEEEVSFQRKVVNAFLFARSSVNRKVHISGVDILRRLTNTFRIIALVMDEFESIPDKNLKERLLLMSSESLSLTSMLLSVLESASPLFLENVFVYEEPILDRIEDLAGFLESFVRNMDELSGDEIAQTVDDIMKTLEYHIRLGERALDKII